MNERSIFENALDIRDPEDRKSYLDEACGDDSQLRQRVEALLASHSKDQSFLAGNAFSIGATASSMPVMEQAGDEIGPFKLLQQIGEGGMGVVYMAEQKEPVKRRVALKIIKPGMDTRQVVVRFEAERQALAMMDHPNIAKVLDCGTTETGRPFFVMELVKGVPVTQYCDDNHLSPRERLELFVPICQAIQHAHQKGIIHRDIKPSNILVAEYDHRAVPKIIDFGVAKALNQQLTEKTMFTQVGQIVGTLEYMSPEQAKVNQLDVDTRSDVYSLGVLLYELLTGATPFDKKRLRSAALDELLRILREEEPPRPSTRLSTIDTLPSVAANRKIEPRRLSMLLHGELDWIVMKALEKDRGRRYDTASAFADDVLHYLNDEHVEACPPSAAYRFRKFARRNKLAITTGSLVAAALVIGIIGTSWQAIRASRQATRAKNAEQLAQRRYEDERNARHEADQARQEEAEQRRIADGERENAEMAKQDAERARDEAQTESARSKTVVNILMELLGSSHSPDETAKPSDYTVAQMVWDFSKRIPPQLESQPAIEADVRSIIGRALAFSENHKEAIGHLERAQVIRRELYGENHAEYANSLLDFHEFYAKGFMPKKAEASARAAMAVSRQLPEEIELRLRCTNALAPYEPLPVRKKLVEEGLELASRHGAESTPLAVGLLLDHARVLFQESNQSDETDQQRDLELVAEAAQQALEAHQQVYGEIHPRTGDCHQLVAEIAEAQGDLSKAEKHYINVLDSLVAHLSYRYFFRGHVMQRLEQIYETRNDDEGFEKLLQRYQNAGAPRYFFLQALQSLDRGDFADYRKVCRRMAATYEGTENDVPRDYLLWAVFPRQDAVDNWQPILTIAAKYSAKFPDSTYAKALHGMILYRAGRYSEALDALKVFTDSIPEDATPEFFDFFRYFLSYPVLFRAMAHHQLGDRESALRWFAHGSHWFHWNLNTDQWVYPLRQRVITQVIHEEARRLIDPDPNLLEVDLINPYWFVAQAQLHMARGDFAAWRSSYKRAIDSLPANGQMRELFANLLRESGRWKEAITHYTKIIELQPTRFGAYRDRGDCLVNLKQYESALADFDQAIQVAENSGQVSQAYQHRSLAHFEMGHFQQALEDIEQALTANRENVWAVSHLGLSRAARCPDQHFQQAYRALADRAIEKSMQNKKLALHHRGLLHRAIGNVEQAVADFTAAADLDPAFVPSIAELGMTYRQQGQYEKALTYADQAADLDPDSVHRYWQRGDIYNNWQKYELAVDDYSRAIECDPSMVWPWNHRGDCYKQLRQFEEAIADYQTALKLGFADRNRIYTNLMQCYTELGQTEQAVAQLDEMIALKPDNAAHWHQRGDFLNKSDKHQAAIDDYTQVIELDPQHVWARHNRGDCYKALGQLEQAIADYQAASRLGFGDHVALDNRLIDCYRQLGKTQQAIADVDKLVDLDADNASHWHRRADYLSLLGQNQLAIEEYSRALELDPEHPWARLNRGHCQARLGNRQPAIDDYLGTRQLLTGNAHFQFVRGERLLELQAYDIALPDFDRAIELAPELWHYYKRRAVTHFHLQNFDLALSDLKQTIDNNPNDISTVVWIEPSLIGACPDESFKSGLLDLAGLLIETTDQKAQALVNRAKLHFALEQDAQAQTDLKSAVETDPDSPQLWNQIGLLYGGRGDEEKAREHYTKTVELDPELWYAWFNRGLAHANLGHNDAAIGDLTESARRNPTHARIYNQRGLLYHRTGQIEKARDDYSRCIELEPSGAVHWSNRAAAHKDLGQFDQAVADADKALEIETDHTNALQWRAQAHVALQNWPQAVADYSRLIELEPNKPARLLNRGKAFLAMGESEKAQGDFERYLQPFNDHVTQHPDDWQAVSRRGVALTNLERWNDAVADFTRAIELGPDQSETRKNRAACYCELQRWPEAAEDLNKALELGDTAWQTFYHLALSRLGNDDLPEYRAACQKMVEAFAETSNPLEANFVAWTCCLAPDAVDDWEPVLKLARLAAEANADSIQNQNTLGTLLMRAGQYEEAIKVLLVVAKQLDEPTAGANTSPAYSWYALALACHQAGQNDEAQKWRDKGDQWTAEILDNSSSNADSTPIAWNRRLTLELFRKEVAAIIVEATAAAGRGDSIEK